MRNTIKLSIVLAAASAALGTQAQDKVLNLYSARHYQTDEVMYDTFTKTTGIKINRVDADDAGIVARLKAEGAASPADVILLVDAARMASADANRGGDAGRATSFESFAITSIDSIEISRTTSASSDADSPAGTINMKTKRAFERKGRRYGRGR